MSDSYDMDFSESEDLGEVETKFEDIESVEEFGNFENFELPEAPEDLDIDNSEYESDLDRMLSEMVEGKTGIDLNNSDELEEMFNDMSDVNDDDDEERPKVKVLKR